VLTRSIRETDRESSKNQRLIIVAFPEDFTKRGRRNETARPDPVQSSAAKVSGPRLTVPAPAKEASSAGLANEKE
jgi:hypothetical protein